jgi:hypothetical protein
MLLFKRKAVARAPVPMVLRAGWGSTRSAAFLAAFVAIYQGAVESVSYFLSSRRDLWLTRELMARLLLLGAKCTSCASWAAAYPCVAARCARLQAVVLAGRPARGNVGAY